MLIRVVKPSAGIIDGVSLSGLAVGLVYDLSTSLGGYLVARGSALPVSTNASGTLVPGDDLDQSIFGGGVRVTPSEPHAIAADRPPRKRR